MYKPIFGNRIKKVFLWLSKCRKVPQNLASWRKRQNSEYIKIRSAVASHPNFRFTEFWHSEKYYNSHKFADWWHHVRWAHANVRHTKWKLVRCLLTKFFYFKSIPKQEDFFGFFYFAFIIRYTTFIRKNWWLVVEPV